jgi:lysine 2,3-aminomutase
LADAGIPLGNQAVLLRGINDDASIMIALMRCLLRMRIRPYYLHQADFTRGTNHFRTPIETGLRIMARMRGHVSGMAVPVYVVDLPGGGGKVPLLPDYVCEADEEAYALRNYRDKLYAYPQPQNVCRKEG